MLETWNEEPRHPFLEKFHLERGRIRGEDVEGSFDLKLIFEHGLQFQSSLDDPGLQLVDSVAYIVRQAVMKPQDGLIQEAYDAFRHKLANLDGHCLTVHGLRPKDAPPSSLARYRPLYGRTRSS